MVKCKEQVEWMTSGKEAKFLPEDTAHFSVLSQVISVILSPLPLKINSSDSANSRIR